CQHGCLHVDSWAGHEKNRGSTTTRAASALPERVCPAQSPPACRRLHLRRKLGGALDAVWQAQLRLRQRPCPPARPLFSTLLEGKKQNPVATPTRRARRALPSMDRQSSAPPIDHPADARRFTKGSPPPAAG